MYSAYYYLLLVYSPMYSSDVCSCPGSCFIAPYATNAARQVKGTYSLR